MLWNLLGHLGIYAGLAAVLWGVITLLDRVLRSRLSTSQTDGAAAHNPIDAFDWDDIHHQPTPCTDNMPESSLSAAESFADVLESATSIVPGSLEGLDS